MRRTQEGILRQRERRMARWQEIEKLNNFSRISLLIVLVFIFCHTLKTVPSIFELFGFDPRVKVVLYQWASLPGGCWMLLAHLALQSLPGDQQQRQLPCLLPGKVDQKSLDSRYVILPQGWTGIPVSRDSREYKPQKSLPFPWHFKFPVPGSQNAFPAHPCSTHHHFRKSPVNG